MNNTMLQTPIPMWRHAYLYCLIALACSIQVATANSSEKYFRQVVDTSHINVPTLASDGMEADVVRVVPSTSSGKGSQFILVDNDGRANYVHMENVRRHYSGKFVLITRIGGELPVFRNGHYEWESEQKFFKASPNGSADRLYNPFVNGGVVLVQPAVKERHVAKQFSTEKLLFPERVNELEDAVVEWKLLANDEGANVEDIWKRIYKQMPSNLCTITGMLSLKLNEELLQVEDIVKHVMGRKNEILAVCCALIARADDLSADARVEILLTLIDAVAEEQRRNVLVGLLASERGRRECMDLVKRSDARGVLFNERNVNSLPEVVQVWLRTK